MNVLKMTPDQILLLDSLGEVHILGTRKATFCPFIFVQHEQHSDEFELIPVGPVTLQEWEEFKRLYDMSNILSPNVVQLL